MAVKRVFITGATGFIGAHIAACFVRNGFMVVAGKRSSSNTWRCKKILDSIIWVDIDVPGWQEAVTALQPGIIIHAAWSGVDATQRELLDDQLANLEFLGKLLELAKQVGVKCFIGIGSQAEYGRINGRIDETAIPQPISAYGFTKMLALQTTQWYCDLHNIPWFWGRVFSCFGEMDNEQWLVPALINAALRQTTIELTKCEQQYDYMYVGDLANLIYKVAEEQQFTSGVYNLSTGKSIRLFDLVQLIGTITGSANQFKIGVKPYRENQSMLMEGDPTKYVGAFGGHNFLDVELAMHTTIEYYKSIVDYHEGI